MAAPRLEAFVTDEGEPLPLTPALREAYGGDLSLPAPRVYANFVQSLDGVVAVPGTVSSGSLISGKDAGDRLVMAILRAAADVVLIGAGTLRDSPGHHWTAEHVFPDMAGEFATLRSELGLDPRPRLAVLSASGAIDVDHPAIREGATVLTTAAGAERLRDTLPPGCEVRSWDGDRVPLPEAAGWLRGIGAGRVLSEAGPSVMGQLVRLGLVDDLFLSVSPVVAGRDGRGQLGFVEGQALLPDQRVTARLVSGRGRGDMLMLRYALG